MSFLRRLIQPKTSNKVTPTHMFPVAPEAPALELDEASWSRMSMNGCNGFLEDSTSPDRLPSNEGANRAMPASHEAETPTDENSLNGLPVLNLASPATNLHPPESTLPNASSDSQNVPWSAAVGRATTGKSGRVIERLMGDNDRLQRELKLSNVKYEEELRQSESARLTQESLKARNESLTTLRDMDQTALARKDRKIEELKADVEVERSRREEAERQNREMAKVVEKYRRELMEKDGLTRQATNQYEVLSKSWKTMEQGFRSQVSKLRTDVKTINEQRLETQRKLAEYDVVVEQLRRENEKSRKAQEKIFQEFNSYKTERDESMREIRERAEKNEDANEKALVVLNETVGQMKYVMNVERDVRAAD